MYMDTWDNTARNSQFVLVLFFILGKGNSFQHTFERLRHCSRLPPILRVLGQAY